MTSYSLFCAYEGAFLKVKTPALILNALASVPLTKKLRSSPSLSLAVNVATEVWASSTYT